jgi:hypothetical protein
MFPYKTALGAVVSAAMVVGVTIANAAPAAAQVYPPPFGVASISIANGSVAIIRGDSGSQVAATINSPVVAGDYVATGAGSDAEVLFDGISMLRLAESTQVRFINLHPISREVQVASGTVVLAELQGAGGRPQVDTPSLSVRPNQDGDYRLSVLGNGQTLVTVRRGSATITTGAGSQTLLPGTTLVAYGSYSYPTITTQGAIASDSFDQFNAARDQAIVAAYNANPYISPQLGGYANFANYGQWRNVPDYGYAWAPNNQTNFSPYQTGQWVWEPGYGYTWVDSQPWGYAPSHYGNWFYNAGYGGWLWQPPSYQYQSTAPAFASAWLPAVVGFFLTGGNGANLASLLGGAGYPNYGNANIGWIPLAPGEPYQPWYGANAYPATHVTYITNVTNIYNYYRNGRYYRGIKMVPISAWHAGNFRHVVIVRPQQLRQIALLRGAIPVVPTTANLRYSSVAVVKHPIVLSRTFSTQRFTAKAPTVKRFSTQQAEITRIAKAKPKTVPLPTQITTTHPVYNPSPHPPVHPITIEKPAPGPIATVRPAPIETVRPHPIVTLRPAPIQTLRPHPIVTVRPAPIQTVRPHTLATAGPHPVTPPRAHPVLTPHPAPAKPKAQPPKSSPPPADGGGKPAPHGTTPPGL